MVLAIRHLDSLDPGADRQLGLYKAYLIEEGYVIGDNIPNTVQMPSSANVKNDAPKNNGGRG